VILSIDPSSTCVGYAMFDESGTLLGSGRLMPDKKNDVAMDRIAGLVSELSALWHEHRPRHCVIEVTSGKVARRLGGCGAGLATYGMAVGACWQMLRSLVGPQNVTAVYENEWTRGVPKSQRLQLLRIIFPGYDPATDPGGDAGDAIMLGEWWFEQKVMRELK
jgi:hypothetical protein